MMNQEAKIKN